MFCIMSLVSDIFFFFFFNDTATTEIYTLSLHDALPILLIRASALGAISTPFAEYLLRSIGRDPALPENAGLVHYVAAAAIAVTAALNYYGVRWSAFVLNLTTGAKYGALLLLVLLAFFVGRGDWTHFTTAAGPPPPRPFGLALVSVLWAYDGWGDLSFEIGRAHV